MKKKKNNVTNYEGDGYVCVKRTPNEQLLSLQSRFGSVIHAIASHESRLKKLEEDAKKHRMAKLSAACRKVGVESSNFDESLFGVPRPMILIPFADQLYEINEQVHAQIEMEKEVNPEHELLEALIQLSKQISTVRRLWLVARERA